MTPDPKTTAMKTTKQRRDELRNVFANVSDELMSKPDGQGIIVGVNLNDAYGFSVAEFNAGDDDQSNIDADAFMQCRSAVLDLIDDVETLSAVNSAGIPASSVYVELMDERDELRSALAAANHDRATAVKELGNLIAYNEGYQEHIGDLLNAMKPFVLLVKDTDGRIPSEKLSFADWHTLAKAFDYTASCLDSDEKIIDRGNQIFALQNKIRGLATFIAENHPEPGIRAVANRELAALSTPTPCPTCDEAKEAISHAYFLVTGKSVQWSENFGYAEATDEIRRVMTQLQPPPALPAQPTPDAGEKPESPTRPFVDSFADAMESKLEKNRHKGDREGWLKDTPRALFERLRQEVDELHTALADGTDAESVLSEAADVANFAMMIADSYQHRSPLRAAGGEGQ